MPGVLHVKIETSDTAGSPRRRLACGDPDSASIPAALLAAFLRLLVILFCLNLTFGCLPEQEVQTSANQPGYRVDPDQVRSRPAPRINPNTHFISGRMLERQGQLEAAIEQYEKAVAMNPKLIQAHNRLGVIYSQLGRFEDADRCFERGIEADPTAVVLHNNLAYSYLMQERYEEAERAFRFVLLRSPDFERARMNLAITLGRQRKYDAGFVEFNKVVSIDEAHYNIGVISAEMGDLDKAETSLRQALAGNPGNAEAKTRLDHVLNLARNDASRLVPVQSPPEAALAGDAGAESNP